MNLHILWLVLIAQAIHVILEENPRFVEWARGYNPDFSRKQFLLGNGVIGGYIVFSILLAVFLPGKWTLALGLSTASYIVFNFLYHAATTLASGVYSPGVVTGGGINVPVALYVYLHFYNAGAVGVFTAGVSVFLGFLPMILILKNIGMKPHHHA
ncbi:MAG: HXXEE domain-containing protein [Desulfatibacillum sp.]|nr:HXXEE domain-containing protein [Desulfatibacillum sp.]